MDNPYNSGRDSASSVLGPTLIFKGELKADEDLLIRGQIEGSIKHSSNLKIGKEGRIDATVDAEHIEVHGEVQGDLTGSQSVVVKQSANVSGNIYSPRVSLHDGAKFNGSIDMSGERAATQESAPKSEAKADATASAEKPSADRSSEKMSEKSSDDAARGKKKSAAKRSADAA